MRRSVEERVSWSIEIRCNKKRSKTGSCLIRSDSKLLTVLIDKEVDGSIKTRPSVITLRKNRITMMTLF